MPKKKKPDLAIAVDFGGSGTKVFYGLVESSKVGSFSMRPEVSEVPKSAIENFLTRKLGSGLPENEAWVGTNGEYAAVGSLASNELSGISRLTALKYEQAVVKFLAAVWVASKRTGGLGKKFNLVASGLLPGAEYADRTRLAKSLTEALSKFETPDGVFEVSLLSFQCYPEGYGIYYSYRARSQQVLFSERIAFFMLGYRNASFLWSNCGTLVLGSGVKQSDLGMVRMIEAVQSRTSGLDAAQLAAAVFAAGDKVERAPLYRICRSLDGESRSEEADRLVEAVHLAREEYLSLLWNWIKEVIPGPVDRLVFSGGTADYLRSEIEPIYTVTPVDFHGGLVVPSEYSVESSNRFADVWMVFQGLLADLEEKFGVEVQVSTSEIGASEG